MKRLLLCLAALILTASVCSAQEKLSIWNGPAPGEKDVSKNPTLLLFQPEKKTTDACLIICPGGCYNGVAVSIEGTPTAKYFVDKGMTVAILVYRTPRRPGVEKYRGDLNEDNTVNVRDLSVLRKAIAGDGSIIYNKTIADINADTVLNTRDVLALKKVIAGLTALSTVTISAGGGSAEYANTMVSAKLTAAADTIDAASVDADN